MQVVNSDNSVDMLKEILIDYPAAGGGTVAAKIIYRNFSKGL